MLYKSHKHLKNKMLHSNSCFHFANVNIISPHTTIPLKNNICEKKHMTPFTFRFDNFLKATWHEWKHLGGPLVRGHVCIRKPTKIRSVRVIKLKTCNQISYGGHKVVFVH